MTVDPPPPADPLKSYRHLFGKPVAVQVAVQFPYLVVIPQTDPKGRPLQQQATNMGVPHVLPQPENYLVGVLRASECGTLYVLQQLVPIERSGDYAGGAGRMDVYIRPEIVTYVTVVTAIEERPSPLLVQ